MLCGLSLYNSNVANLPFPLALFKKLLGQQPSLEDLKELSPLLGRSVNGFPGLYLGSLSRLGINDVTCTHMHTHMRTHTNRQGLRFVCSLDEFECLA